MKLSFTKSAATEPPADAPPAFIPASPELAAMLAIAERMNAIEPALGVPHPLLISKSMLATWIGELRVRVEARGYRFWNPQVWRDLGGSCLASDLRERAILDQLDTLARLMHAQDNPPAIVPPLPTWLEIAADIEVQLPESRAAAARVLEAALAKIAAENPRARWPWKMFAEELLNGGTSPLAKTLRHALAGYGLPAVRRGSLFGDRPPALSPLPPIVPFPVTINSGLDSWLATLAPLFGLDHRVPTQIENATRGPVRAAAAVEDLQRRRDAKELVKGGDHKANVEAYRLEAAAVEVKHKKELRDLNERLAAEREAIRTRIIAAVDRKLAELERAEPGSLRVLWTRDLRLAMTNDPDHAPLFGPRGHEHASSSWRWLRDAGVRFDVEGATR